MTDNQKNIIGTILLNMSASTLPVTEETISNLVDMNDNMNTMMYGTPKMKPVSGLKVAIYGAKTKREVAAIQKEALNNVIRRIMEG